MMKTKKIFNVRQADLFAKNGCHIVGVGVGRKGKIYLLFEVNHVFNKMMKKWDNHDFIEQ